MTAGTGLIMWLGELDHRQGHRQRHVAPDLHLDRRRASPARCGPSSSGPGWDVFLGIILMGFVVIALVVFVEQSQRRIPVQYAKRMVGRRDVRRHLAPTSRSRSTWPASSRSSSPARCSSLPALLAQFNRAPTAPARAGSTGSTPTSCGGDHPIYMLALHRADPVLHVLLRVDHVQPDRGRRQHEEVRRLHPGYPRRATHGRVPRLRPDPDHRARARSTSRSISLIPLIALVLVGANQNFPFGGTSILIIVGVGLETVKQIESQLQQRHYEGFLR